MKQKKGLTFPVLSDMELEATRAYGILNEKNGKVPHPTVVIIAQDGTVRFFHLDENYRQRPDPELLLEAAGELENPDAGE